MRLIANIANYLRGIIEKKDEFKEPSGGFLPYRVRKKTVSLLKNYGKILDVGAGEGLLLKAMGAKSNKWFYGIDRDKKKLEQSTTRRPNKDKALFVYGDGLRLPFKNDAFDEVALLNIFLNIPDDAVIWSLLNEALRVCKTAGTLIFDYRNRGNILILLSYRTVSIHDPELTLPLRGFSRREVKAMLRSLGIAGGVLYHPIPSWWKINPPAYLVEIRKSAVGGRLL